MRKFFAYFLMLNHFLPACITGTLVLWDILYISRISRRLRPMFPYL